MNFDAAREAAVDREKPEAATVTEKLAFSIDELSMVTGICRDNLYEEIRDGRLKAKKFGKRTLVLKAAAQAFLDGLPDLRLPPKELEGEAPHTVNSERRRAHAT